MRHQMLIQKLAVVCSIPVLLVISAGCSKSPTEGQTKAGVTLKRMAPGAENAGFLSSYANLKPNPRFENTLTFVKQDDAKNVRKYFAVIIEPVEIYVATNADVSKLPDRGRTALAAYFQNAITRAVSDAFPVVQEPGPLVLRLRTALIGVDAGAAIPADQKSGAEGLDNAIDISKVGVEVEMVDSVTGEQIVAAIDRQNLGAGATVDSEALSRDEKSEAAREAFDGWAQRLRDFLDSAQEKSAPDMERADESYRPYGHAPKGK